MTIPTNYTTLQTAIEEDLARSDLTAELPNFIQKGEAILNRKLRLMSQETTASLTLSSGASTISLPTGFLEHIDLSYDTDNWQPTQVGWADLGALESTASGRPDVFAIGENIAFNQSADQNYSLTQRYFKKWDIATDTTNSLLTNNPDIYLYAGLVGSISRTGTHARADAWVQLLDEAVNGLTRVDGRTRRHRVARTDLPGTSGRFNINRGW